MGTALTPGRHARSAGRLCSGGAGCIGGRQVVALSSGRKEASAADLIAFEEQLERVCCELAADVVRNGEGVRHVIQVTVRGAPCNATARGVGKAVVNSPLTKCAIAGNDPNVGRIVGAIGDYLGSEVRGVTRAAQHSSRGPDCPGVCLACGATHTSPLRLAAAWLASAHRVSVL